MRRVGLTLFALLLNVFGPNAFGLSQSDSRTLLIVSGLGLVVLLVGTTRQVRGAVSRLLANLSQRVGPASAVTPSNAATAEARPVPWETLRDAIDTAMTWLYRREEWHGLTDDGKQSEGAWDVWVAPKWSALGLKDLPYTKPVRTVGGEPGFTAPKMSRQMDALHHEGLDKLDELRGLRTHGVEAHTKRHYDSWFHDWDQKASQFVIDKYGVQYWGRFGGDDGALRFVPGGSDEGINAFPEWVLEMIDGVDRRLRRIRWIANGMKGLM